MSKRVTHTVRSDGTSETSTVTTKSGCSSCMGWFLLIALVIFPVAKWPLLWIVYAPAIVFGIIVWASNRRRREEEE